MSVLVAQLGARRHYAVPRALNARGLLDRLVTDFCADPAPWRWIGSVMPQPCGNQRFDRFFGRSTRDIEPRRIVNMTRFALSRQYRRGPDESQTDYWARRNAAFCALVLPHLPDGGGSVYAYNGAALELFEAARARGLRTVLDQTAAPWRYNRQLLEEEHKRWPGWEEGAGEVDTSGRLTDREEAEWQLADRIICGSRFAANAVAATGGPQERCKVLPYAGHVPSATHAGRNHREGRLRVLFAGTLQLRKGLPYLTEAAKLLKHEPVDIRVVGQSHLSPAGLAAVCETCDVVGPVPRDQMKLHYGWADVFVLPTLSEGSANVVYEAMAAGLATVTTQNAGSIIEDGKTGLIVPARDPHALARALVQLADDRALCAELATHARSAVEGQGLDAYADGLSEAVAA